MRRLIIYLAYIVCLNHLVGCIFCFCFLNPEVCYIIVYILSAFKEMEDVL